MSTPLDKAPDALRYVEDGHPKGKVVVTVGDERPEAHGARRGRVTHAWLGARTRSGPAAKPAGPRRREAAGYFLPTFVATTATL